MIFALVVGESPLGVTPSRLNGDLPAASILKLSYLVDSPKPWELELPSPPSGTSADAAKKLIVANYRQLILL